MKIVMNQVYKVKKEDLIGYLKGFPIQVVQMIIDRQREQGNKENIKIFQYDIYTPKSDGGFSWDETPEGDDFWNEVLCAEDFDLFFEKYPELKNIENEEPNNFEREVEESEEKIDTHVYYKGVFYRGHEIIVELEKLGGINKFDLYGDRQEWYYYINPFNNYIVVAKTPDEIDLLKFVYTENFLTEDTKPETILIDGKQYNKKEVLDKIKDLKEIEDE